MNCNGRASSAGTFTHTKDDPIHGSQFSSQTGEISPWTKELRRRLHRKRSAARSEMGCAAAPVARLLWSTVIHCIGHQCRVLAPPVAHHEVGKCLRSAKQHGNAPRAYHTWCKAVLDIYFRSYLDAVMKSKIVYCT